MMKCYRFARFMAAAVLLILSWSVLTETVQARPRQKEIAAPSTAIPADKRPWKGIPWVIGGVLSAGAIAVGFKNAKRTHLD